MIDWLTTYLSCLSKNERDDRRKQAADVLGDVRHSRSAIQVFGRKTTEDRGRFMDERGRMIALGVSARDWQETLSYGGRDSVLPANHMTICHMRTICTGGGLGRTVTGIGIGCGTHHAIVHTSAMSCVTRTPRHTSIYSRPRVANHLSSSASNHFFQKTKCEVT